MEVVSGALFKLAKATNDAEAYYYHQYVTLIDLTLEQLIASTGRLPEVVARAIDAYLPEQYGDHRILNVIKDALEIALRQSCYKAVRDYKISESSDDEDIK
jgi:hypothetical protein